MILRKAAPTSIRTSRPGVQLIVTKGAALSAKSSSRRILELDGLRGIAILLVILYHFISMTPHAPPNGIVHYLQAAFRMGWAGVDLFFVLSGFLIGGILLDAKDSPRYFRTFYLRRIHRILPIYYLWIGAYFLIAFTPVIRWVGPLGIAPDKWTIIPVYSLFLENIAWSRGPAFRTAWLSGLWSLAVEEQFYLIMPSVVRFLSKRTLVISLFLAILGAPLARILVYKYLVPAHGAAPYILTPCRADALAMGVLLAVAWREERWKQWMQSHLRWLYAILGLLFVGVAYLNLIGETQYGYTMTVWGYSCIDAFFLELMVLALMLPRGIWASVCRWPILIDLGGISYCVYIIHGAVYELCHFALSSSVNGISSFSSLVATIFAAAIIWLVAKISWRYLEHPMIRRGHRYRY
jgi:peptidoglycan/LPS O-acetylase OafA/YrhL